ncbi:MAG TPA: hypothetical protein VF240_05305 [Pyrinomonadaceae bacterium]
MKNLLRACALSASLPLLLVSSSCDRKETARNQNDPAATPDRADATPTPPGEQTQATRTETPYRVKPVFLPELQRPPLTPNREALPRGVGGDLPTYDGEPFQLNFGADQKIEPGRSGELVNQVLSALGWQRGAEEVRESRRAAAPAARGEAVEEAIKRAVAEDERRLSGEMGRLSEATKKEIRERAERLRAEAARTQDVLVYDQRVDGVRVEHTGFVLAFRPDRGLTSLSGRVFNRVDIANQRRLTEEDAARLAAEHVSKTTKLAPPPDAGAQQQPPPRPELVLLPYADAMRYAWRVDVAAEEGVYRLWLDAESGEVLQLEPLFKPDSGNGLVFDPDPNVGTRELHFEVNGPSASNYSLVNSRIDVGNSGADGQSSGDLTIADASTGGANFNVPPINGTVVRRTSQTDYNSRFQEVNAFAWVAHTMKYVDDWGGTALPDMTVTVNHNNPCGFGTNNACGGGGSITMGIGRATTSASTSANDFFNSAIDATVVTHELGHTLTPTQMTGGGTLIGSADEGLADYWAATIHNNPTFGGFWGANRATHSQTGFPPRLAETLDVFPEHRNMGGAGSNNQVHADGEIIRWALWSARTGMLSLSSLGSADLNAKLFKALNTHGVGLTNNLTDRSVHDSYRDLLAKLAPQYTTGNANKLMAGFARAGIHLSERDAVIDISDDWLERGSATGPTFTVWGGRDYQFNMGSNTATAATNFNTRYQIEVANDAAFTSNLISSGFLTNIAVGADGVPSALWALPAANWTTLKAADKIYYRVTTTDGAGANSRSSLQPGNNFLGNAVDPPYANINESGQCECECASAAVVPTAKSFLSWATLLPPLAALVWRRRSRRKGDAG